MRLSPFSLLCATGLLAIFSSTISKSPVLPLFASHLGADPSGVGAIAAVSAGAGVLFSVPAGLLADRFGRKRLLVSSALIFTTAPFCYLLITEIWQLALVRFYHGFATAIFVPVAMALVSELSHKARGEQLGWFSTATLIGRFMAPVVGSAILGALAWNASFSYRVVYTVCGVAGLIALLLSCKLPAAESRGTAGQPWAETLATFKVVITHQQILMTSAVEAAILFAYGTFETFIPLYALDNGLSAYHVGIFLAGQVIALTLSKPICGRFSDRHGRRPQIVAGGLLGAVCIGSFALVHSFLPLLGLSLAFGLSLSVVTSATSAYIADLSSQQGRGSAMGLLGSIMDLGHTTGPLLSGVVASYFGYGPAFVGAAVVLAGVAWFFWQHGPTPKLREGSTDGSPNS